MYIKAADHLCKQFGSRSGWTKLSIVTKLFIVIGRALDKPAYRVNYKNVWQDMHLIKF